jgi:hypothetical protein
MQYLSERRNQPFVLRSLFYTAPIIPFIQSVKISAIPNQNPPGNKTVKNGPCTAEKQKVSVTVKDCEAQGPQFPGKEGPFRVYNIPALFQPRHASKGGQGRNLRGSRNTPALPRTGHRVYKGFIRRKHIPDTETRQAESFSEGL